MGFWSSIKNAVSKVAKNIVSGITRGLTKLVTFGIGFVIGALSSIFLFWATKKIRLHVCILQPLNGKELVSVSEAELAVERAAVLIKGNYDTKVRHYGSPYVEILKEPAPDSALDTRCADSWTDADDFANVELGEGGSFYAAHTAGWNAIPITFSFPITIFVVRSVRYNGEQWRGCSFGLLTDYVVITPEGLADSTTLAHELSHSCGLFHRKKKNNLMYSSANRGTTVTGWQKWWFRASRHVNHW